MSNPRLLIQIPLLLLGSCTPITPASIQIYNNINIDPDLSQVDSRLKPRVDRLMEKECKAIEKAELNAYHMPNLPDISKMDPDDSKALIDALFAHISELRKQYGTLKDQFQCNLDHPKT